MFSRPFFVAMIRIGGALMYYGMIVPFMLVVLGIPIAFAMSFPANSIGAANLGAVLAVAYLIAVALKARGRHGSRNHR